MAALSALNLPAEIRHWLSQYGVDRVFAVNLSTRLWMLVFGPVVLAVIVHRLTLAEQGFYYTFISLIGLSVFLDMGFTRAIQVFVSHEFAHLRLERGGSMEGDGHHARRVGDFGKAILLCHLALAVVAGAIIGLVGEFMFGREGGSVVGWRGPWWSLSFAAAAAFINVPMSTMLEAAGHVPHMTWVKLARQIATSLALVGALLNGAGLASAAISAWIGFFVSFALITAPYRRFWSQILRGSLAPGLRHFRQLADYQVRIAIGWACGYFIFSVMTPIAFYVLGPEDAARMGLTWQVMGIVSGIAFSVIQAKTPALGTLVGQGRGAEALAVNRRATRGALALAALGYAVILAGLLAVRTADSMPWPDLLVKGAARMLPVLPIALLSAAELGKLQMLGTMSFVRSLKVEPFTPMLVVLAFLVPAGCWILGARFGIEWLCLGYVAGQAIAHPWSSRLARPYLSRHSPPGPVMS